MSSILQCPSKMAVINWKCLQDYTPYDSIHIITLQL